MRAIKPTQKQVIFQDMLASSLDKQIVVLPASSQKHESELLYKDCKNLSCMAL